MSGDSIMAVVDDSEIRVLSLASAANLNYIDRSKLLAFPLEITITDVDERELMACDLETGGKFRDVFAKILWWGRNPCSKVWRSLLLFQSRFV